MSHFLTIVISYLMGSIPTGLLLARLKGIDVRKVGSGNIGFSNVMRVAGTDRKGKILGFLTLAGDMGKGFLAVRLSYHYGALTDPILAGLFVFLGHLFPVWLRGKGGKGVATGLGVALGINPLIGFLVCLPWAVLFLLTRTPSIASLGSFAVLPILSVPEIDRKLIETNSLPPYTSMLFVSMAALVFLRHRENIKRLIKGKENNI